MKKIRVIISLAVMLCILTATAVVSYAADVTGNTGTCTWKYSNGVLLISGEGSMADYTSSGTWPWSSYASSITTIEIADEVEYIGNYAFYNLTKATTANIGAGVEKIGSFAFRNCTSLATVNYNAEKCEVAGTKSTMIFYGCSNLKTVNFGDGVKYIPANLLLYCQKITSVTLPESVYKIGEYAFGYCSALTTMALPNKLAEIPEYVFYKCSAMTSVNVPNMLSNIGNYAFYGCSSLPELALPATVSEIGYGAFEECTNLNISTTEGSYAELFAKEYGISYTATSVSTPSVELTVNTKTSAHFLNGYLTLGVKFDQPLSDECVHMAFYNAEGKVSNYFISPIVLGDTDYMSIHIDADDVNTAVKAKIFVWDGLDSCMPISPVETITLSR